MPQATQPTDLHQRRDAWIARVRQAFAEIAEWARAEGWQVNEDQKTIQERIIGSYQVPVLAIHLPGGDIEIDPVGFHVMGAEGRIDVRGFPTLSRVSLIGSSNAWTIMTDSNVPIRQPWNHQTFVQLAHDLLA